MEASMRSSRRSPYNTPQLYDHLCLGAETYEKVALFSSSALDSGSGVGTAIAPASNNEVKKVMSFISKD